MAAELKPYKSEWGDDTRSRQHQALRNRMMEEEESEEECVAEEIWEPPLHEYQNAQRDKSIVSKPPSKTQDAS